MTIKWVATDPLVMNGEPFCYATRLTVRNVLEMRANGLRPDEMIADHPELRRVGIAEAFLYASQHPERYGAFIGPTAPFAGRASSRRRPKGCRSISALRSASSAERGPPSRARRSAAGGPHPPAASPPERGDRCAGVACGHDA
jgi:uncharacterized protein (DUF433 family)